MGNWLTDLIVPVRPEVLWLLVLRAVLAAGTGLGLVLVAGPFVIRLLARLGCTEPTHKTPIEDRALADRIGAKAGTPTMGGLLILGGLFTAVALWGRIDNLRVAVTLACVTGLAVLGLVDDYRKLRGASRRDRGLKARYKVLIQLAAGAGCGLMLWRVLSGGGGTAGLTLARWLRPGLWMGIGFAIWTGLVVSIMSNSSNVTDGLDGLAAGLALPVAAGLAVAAAAAGATGAASGSGAAELAVFCAALAGSLLGFLWYNRHPARLFMGDTGSLAVGGGLAMAAVAAGQELLLVVLGLVLLGEFGSSLLQIFCFKLTGRRILPIAPLHHLFEQKGWSEGKIVAGFYAGGLVCVLFAALTLSF